MHEDRCSSMHALTLHRGCMIIVNEYDPCMIVSAGGEPEGIMTTGRRYTPMSCNTDSR